MRHARAVLAAWEAGETSFDDESIDAEFLRAAIVPAPERLPDDSNSITPEEMLQRLEQRCR